MKVAINILNAAKILGETKIEDLEDKRIVPKMMLRRRLTRNAKIMLYIADRCGFREGKVIYASAFGELQATVGITDAILDATAISPTLFQNSVYNSAPSYFSLLNADKDEIITLSNGDKSSLDAIKTAALQAVLSGEKVLCAGSECLDIKNIQELNSCTKYLESGAGVVLEMAEDEEGALELESLCEEGVIPSMRDLMSLVEMQKSGKTKVYIEL